jgi:HSP20 family protein
MANLIRRTEAPSEAPAVWDPFRLMRDFMNWDPFAEMAPSLIRAGESMFSPRFEVKETKNAYVFKADLPGLEEKDLEITVTGSRVTVSGKREAENKDEDETYYAYERSYGRFTRTFTLPDDANTSEIRAELKDGVLSLVVPKKPESQPQKVPISTEQTTKH